MENNQYYIWTLLEWLTKNNKDEQGAILEYSHLLKFMNVNKNNLISILGEQWFYNIENKMKEHISDEQVHSKDLTEIYVKLSGIPIAKD